MVRARSLDYNNLTNGGRDISGILMLAEALPRSQLTSLRSAKTALERLSDFSSHRFDVSSVNSL